MFGENHAKNVLIYFKFKVFDLMKNIREFKFQIDYYKDI